MNISISTVNDVLIFLPICPCCVRTLMYVNIHVVVCPPWPLLSTWLAIYRDGDLSGVLLTYRQAYKTLDTHSFSTRHGESTVAYRVVRELLFCHRPKKTLWSIKSRVLWRCKLRFKHCNWWSCFIGALNWTNVSCALIQVSKSFKHDVICRCSII